MPQDSLFDRRKAFRITFTMSIDPLTPSKPWLASCLITDQHNAVIIQSTKQLPPTWEVQTFKDAVGEASVEFEGRTPQWAVAAFNLTIKEWTKSAEALLT